MLSLWEDCELLPFLPDDDGGGTERMRQTFSDGSWSVAAMCGCTTIYNPDGSIRFAYTCREHSPYLHRYFSRPFELHTEKEAQMKQ